MSTVNGILIPVSPVLSDDQIPKNASFSSLSSENTTIVALDAISKSSRSSSVVSNSSEVSTVVARPLTPHNVINLHRNSLPQERTANVMNLRNPRFFPQEEVTNITRSVRLNRRCQVEVYEHTPYGVYLISENELPYELRTSRIQKKLDRLEFIAYVCLAIFATSCIAAGVGGWMDNEKIVMAGHLTSFAFMYFSLKSSKMQSECFKNFEKQVNEYYANNV